MPGIIGAVRASQALRVFVCNVATQPGETQGYDLADHLAAVERHTSPGLLDVVLANNQFAARRPGAYSAEPVRLRWPPASVWPQSNTPRLVLDDVVESGQRPPPRSGPTGGRDHEDLRARVSRAPPVAGRADGVIEPGLGHPGARA